MARRRRLLSSGPLHAVLGASGLVAVLVGPAPVDPVDLTWDAPPPCPTQDLVVETLRGHLASATAPPLSVRAKAHVQTTDEGFRLELQILADAGEVTRVLEHPRCEELADTAALLVAMSAAGQAVPSSTTETMAAESNPEATQTDPNEAASPEPIPEPDGGDTASSPGSSEAPTSQAPRAAGVPPSAVRPSARAPKLRGHTSLESGITVGQLPTLAPVLALHFGVAGPSYLAEVGIDGSPPVEGTLEEGRVRVQVWTGSARACAAPKLGPVVVLACGGFQLGGMIAEALDVANATQRTSFYASAVVGTGVMGWFHRNVGLELRFEGVVALYRPQFVLAPDASAHTTGPAGFRAVAGLVFGWP